MVPGFLDRIEAADALDGVHRFYMPGYEGYVASGRGNPIPSPREVFPWDHSGLNHAITRPDLIDAAERITGTTDLRLAEAHLGVKYAGDTAGVDWHIDYGNNTLGPEIEDPNDMHRHHMFFLYFTDVGPYDAPIRLLRHGGRPHADGEDVIGPAGTLCIYTLYTWHTATPYRALRGHRAAAWVAMYDARRSFDFPRAFTYKTGADGAGMARFIREASPRRLQLLGFPPPGDALWTDAYIAGMEKRYPGFRGGLYRT